MVARYLGGNPNGSLRDIAGITQRARQRRRPDAAPRARVEEGFGPGTDGLGFFTLVEALVG